MGKDKITYGSMFYTTEKGFLVDYPNGLTVSVQWGRGNYCYNRHKQIDYSKGCRCDNAEIAVFSGDRSIFDDGTNGVGITGWLSSTTITKAMAVVAAFDRRRSESELVERLRKVVTEAPASRASSKRRKGNTT